jgi:hypothetical protein
MRLSADQRRVLDLLDAGSPHGLTENVLLARGFTVEMLIGLVTEGLASAESERVRAGRRIIEVGRIQITDAGRRALNIE